MVREAVTIDYTAAPTVAKFHNADNFVRALMGPFGSGKSVGVCMEMLMRALAQEPFVAPGDSYPTRRTRWAIIRNSYRELQDTTIRTFFDWIPEFLGRFKKMDMEFLIHRPLEDGTILHAEFLFRALDKPKDIKKLLSLELTGAWMNEAREIPLAVFNTIQGRLGRYPSKKEGGPTWFGLILDTNPPDEDHWIYKMFEEKRPKEWSIFKQPSGLSADAENIENLPPNYYQNMVVGKDSEWVKVYVHGSYGYVSDGRNVYPEYNDNIHYTDEDLLFDSDETVWLGLDFGLTPAATIGQNIRGQWRIIDEVIGNDVGALQFGRELGRHLRQHYRGCTISITGDPAGEHRAETDKHTPYEILASLGIDASPAHTNDFTIRRETVANLLGRMTHDGDPAFIIGPKCRMLRKGMRGAYKYRRLQVVGEDRYVDVPDKNKYSHVCESLQYLLMGAGEDDSLLGSGGWKSVDQKLIESLNRAAR